MRLRRRCAHSSKKSPPEPRRENDSKQGAGPAGALRLKARVNLPRQTGSTDWDAIVESWFDSEDTAAWPDPIKSELLADRPKFVSHIEFFFVDEHVVIDPPGASPV